MTGPTLASAGWRRGITFGVPLAAVLWALIELLHLKGDHDVERYPWWSLILAAVGALIVFALLEVVGSRGPANRRKYGWIAIAIGSDGRISTSKTQALLWTIVLAIAITFLAGIVAFGPPDAADIFDDVQWEQYLVLLGGPFAAAVLAKVAVVTKLQAGTVQTSLTAAASRSAVGARADVAGAAAGAATDADADPTLADEPPPADEPRAHDALANDDGEIDLVDTQYLIFNFVAVLYFVVVFLGHIFDGGGNVDRFALPDIPAVLLGLTGASAATYVGNKAAQRSAPRIVSMSPQPVTPGGEVDVLGVNLIPPGESAASAATATSVMIKKLDAGATEDDVAIVAIKAKPDPTASAVKFLMPAKFADSTVSVRVVTSSAIATDPYPVKVNAAG
jgi:hypothetical protein